jgi:hypothetical protein
MFGLIALIVVGAYGIAVIWLAKLGWKFGVQRFGTKTLKNSAKAFFCSCLGFGLLTVPILWEALPTYWTYKRVAADDSGLKVFKTVETWKKENPGYDKNPVDQTSYAKVPLPGGWIRTPRNARISSDFKLEKYSNGVFASRERLVDRNSGEILATYSRVESGHGGAPGGPGWWKVWLRHSSLEGNSAEWLAWSLLHREYVYVLESK